MDVKYIHTQDIHNLKAPEIIVPTLIELFKPQSVVDIGCGLATFLHVFRQNGVVDIVGVDGAWVSKDKLYVEENVFVEADLEERINLNRKFDLVICLEVVEHLHEYAANTIVESLVSLGDKIIFSAAVENQGGQNHLNEKNFSYWQEIFEKHNYLFYDVFRPLFWNNSSIEWWYKQNMFLVAKNGIHLNAEILKSKVDGSANVYIHPGTLQSRVSEIQRLTENIEAMRDGNVTVSFYFKGLKNKIVNIVKKIFRLNSVKV